MRQIVLVSFPGVNLLDVAGPTQVFTSAAEILTQSGQCEDGGYRVRLVSADGGLVETTSGLKLAADPIAGCRPGDIDTLLISGGHGSENAGANARLIAWLRAARPKVRRLGSICTGAFVLAASGLLNGRRAATHWAYCDRLKANYPQIDVDGDAIFVEDGGIWTSAGITSGMDLALAMLEEDWGRELALLVSRRLVLYLKRSGGQSQFSVPLQAQTAEGPIAKLVKRVVEHPADDHSVENLASHAGMSERTLYRLFHESFGRTPAEWVKQMRIESARTRLEETRDSIDDVAAKSGFPSGDTMRRVFLRHLGVSPSDYREQFQRTGAPPSAALQLSLKKSLPDAAA